MKKANDSLPVARKKEKAAAVYSRLEKNYPDASCELHYSSPLELLIATILSAQCTDAQVNKVTPALFKRFRTAKSLADAAPEEIEEIIRPTGFFRQKTKSIQGAARKIVAEFNGEVPQTIEELVTLPGVGRKTANVVLGNVFKIPGLPVDTHVLRLSKRIGLTRSFDPVIVEEELCSLLPAPQWTMFSHLLIWHGRRQCNARRPECEQCSIKSYCDFAIKARSNVE